ncbi:MAG: hypothetical protein ACKVG9_00075 [Rhodospirillales bacterium]
MKITNNLGMPDPLAAAVTYFSQPRDRSDIGDFSITELLGPPQQHQLVLKHYDEIEEDVSDSVYALFGHGIHQLMELHSPSDVLVEKRLSVKMALPEMPAVKISGKFDLVDNQKTIVDYKVSSIWEAVNGLKEERTQQLNCYDYLCYQNGIDVHQASVVMIFRDWSKMNVSREASHPKRQVQIFPVTLWTREEQENFLLKRIRLHLEARTAAASNQDMAECTPAERWARPTLYAVSRKDRQKAVRLCDSQEDAKAYIQTIKKDRDKHYIETRQGVDTRCVNYCKVNQFCPQFLKNEQDNMEKLNDAAQMED